MLCILVMECECIICGTFQGIDVVLVDDGM